MSLESLKILHGPAALRLLEKVADPELLAERAGEPPRVLFHDGPLTVPGDLVLPSDPRGPAVLVVKGNLTVQGSLRDSADPPFATVVLGDLRADVALLVGSLDVSGDLRARVVVGGDSDQLCRVGGALEAEIFYSEEHFFEAGSARIGRAVGNCYRLDVERGKPVDFVDGEDRDILGVLVEDVLRVERDEDDDVVSVSIDHAAFVKHVLAGAPVLRPPSSPSA